MERGLIFETATEQWWLPPEDRSPSAWVAWASELPMVRRLGAVCTGVGDASATFVVPTTPMVPNPNASVNGGIVIAIADLVMGVLGALVAPPGQLPGTGTLNTQFHSPALAPLTLHGSVVRAGRRLTFVEVTVEDKNGVRCASCQGTMIAGASVRKEQ